MVTATAVCVCASQLPAIIDHLKRAIGVRTGEVCDDPRVAFDRFRRTIVTVGVVPVLPP